MKERDIVEYTKEYMNAPFLKENVYYRRRCVLEQLKKYKHATILEIGCGMFPLFQYMNDDYDKYYIVEPSEVFSSNARNIVDNLYGTNKKINIYTAYFEEILDEVIGINPDFIVCSSLLHEVPDEKRLLQAIREVATDKSVIHINVPNATSIHRLIAESAGMIDNVYIKSETQNKLQQRDIYDMDKLKTTMSENGFIVLDAGSYFIKPFTHKQMSSMLEYQIIDESVLEGLWNLTKYFPENGSEIYVNARK